MFFPYTHTYIPFHLKEGGTYSLFLAYPNCQQHCSCTLSPLVSKIMGSLKTRTLMPWQWIWDSYQVTTGQVVHTAWGHQKRDDSHPRQWREMVWDFIMQLRTARNLKLINCFKFISRISYLIFSDYGWLWVTETVDSKTTAKRGTTVSKQLGSLLKLQIQI